MASAGAEAGLRVGAGLVRPSTVALFALLIATTALRLLVGRYQPLWLDEAWTGMIASRPTPAALFHELHQDVNGPLYYLVAWVAAPVLGLSNSALRLPAALFGSLAPIVCLVLPDRRVARLWCALSALWVMGLIYSEEARCFTLLWALSTGSTVALARLLGDARRGTAALWVALTSLAVLTHYFAAFLAVGQVVVLIGRQGRGALRLWPASLVALPALGWLAFHAGRVAEFSAAGVGWYPLLRFWTGVNMARELAGSDLLAALLPLLVLMLLWGRATKRPRLPSPVMDAAIASIVGMALPVAIGVLHPSLTARYLIPFVPGLLLWLSIMALRPEREVASAPVLLVCAFALAAGLWAAARPTPLSRIFSWETASDWVLERRPAGLVFVWDNPSARAIWPASMARVGGFFAERSGRAVPTRSMMVQGRDPNGLLGPLPGDQAIIWIYDSNVRGTEAVAHPPHLATAERECRQFGRWWMNVYACRPVRPPAPPVS